MLLAIFDYVMVSLNNNNITFKWTTSLHFDKFEYGFNMFFKECKLIV